MSSQGSPQFGLASLLLEAAEILERREMVGEPHKFSTASTYTSYHSPSHEVPRSDRLESRSRSAARKTFDVDSESSSSDTDTDGGMKSFSSSSDSPPASPRAATKAARNKPYRRPTPSSALRSSSSGGGSGRKPRGPAQHNEVEKRRRAYLSSCYVELHGLVPTIKDAKASNVTILQSAADHIHELEANGSRLVARLKRERLRRKELLTRACLPHSFLQDSVAPSGLILSPSTTVSARVSDAMAMLAMATAASPGLGGGHTADDEGPADDEDDYGPLVPDLAAADEEMVPTVDDVEKVVQQSPLKLTHAEAMQPDGSSRRRSSRRPVRFT